MYKFFIYLMAMLVLCSCLFAGLAPLAQPKTIVIKNSSGVDLSLVTLSAEKSSAGRSQRFGSVSPVLDGTVQITERGSSSPPLPPKIVMSWEDRGGREYQRLVDLTPILSPAKDLQSFSLVFEVGPGGALNVFVTTRP